MNYLGNIPKKQLFLSASLSHVEGFLRTSLMAKIQKKLRSVLTFTFTPNVGHGKHESFFGWFEFVHWTKRISHFFIHSYSYKFTLHVWNTQNQDSRSWQDYAMVFSSEGSEDKKSSKLLNEVSVVIIIDQSNHKVYYVACQHERW